MKPRQHDLRTFDGFASGGAGLVHTLICLRWSYCQSESSRLVEESHRRAPMQQSGVIVR